MKIKSLLFLVLISLTCAKQLRFLQGTAPKVAENGKPMVEEVTDMVSTAFNIMNQTGAAKFMGYVGMIIDAVATIMDTFKSSNVRTFEKVVPGKGYKSLQARYEWDFTLGHRLQYYEEWKKQMAEQFKVSDNDTADFLSELETGQFARKEIFSSYSFMKNADKKPEKDKDGNYVCHFLNFLTYHYRKDCKSKFDAVISQAEIHLKLYPNKLVFRREKSIAGGIERSTTYETEWQERDITPNDLDDILNFFQLTTYNELSKNLGIITNIVLE